MTTDDLSFIYTWEEWDQLLEDNAYDLCMGVGEPPQRCYPAIICCPRCEEETGEERDIADCPCLTFGVVEEEGLETVEVDGRLWAKRPPSSFLEV